MMSTNLNKGFELVTRSDLKSIFCLFLLLVLVYLVWYMRYTQWQWFEFVEPLFLMLIV